MLKAHGKGIMEEEAQIQPKESAKGLYGYGQQGLARRYLLFPPSTWPKLPKKILSTNEQEKDPIYT